MKTKILSFLILIILGTSCSKSLVYSPAVNLPQKMLKEKEIDLSGGVELMPEARAEFLGGRPTTLGLNGQIRYALSDQFNMSFKGWIDVEGRGSSTRSGFSMAWQVIKPKDTKSRFIFLPQFGMVLNGDNISGYGVSSSIIYHEEMSDRFSFYLGGGVLWGFRFFDKLVNEEGETRWPMGFGLIGNTGVAFEIANGFRVNMEVAPIVQLNTFDKNYQVMLAPQIGVGYTLRGRGE